MIGFPSAGSAAPQQWSRRHAYPTYGERGMVAAAHPLAAEAGLHVLRQGGNAIDAAVAAGLAAAVVMPEMCGLGGDLFAVVHIPGQPGRNPATMSIQGSGNSPRSASIDLIRHHATESGQMPYQGPLSISVPGMVDAYFQMLVRFGTRSFAEVMEPAHSLAADGFIVHQLGAESIAASADVLARDEAAAAVFLPSGNPVPAGKRLVQADLGRTLQTLAGEGADVFYRGVIGERITSYLTSVGGALSMEDFANHVTGFTQPLETTYRGHTVYQTGLPSQGLILLEALNIIEGADLSDPLSTDAIHLMVEAKKLAFADRLGHSADPAFHRTPIDILLSKEWGAQRIVMIDIASAATDVAHGRLQDGDTTYIAVADAGGMMVSLIQSVSSSFGSGIIGGDTGVVLNNRVGRGFSLEEGHPNIYAPGKKTMHTLNCFLIADKEGRPVLIGGTPGGDGQPQWNLQAIVGMIDAGLDVQAAIEQPRWTSWPGTDPSTVANPFELRIEDRLPESVVEKLATKGHSIRKMSPWGGGGAAQIIARDPDTGIMIGGTDARVKGNVLGF